MDYIIPALSVLALVYGGVKLLVSFVGAHASIIASKRPPTNFEGSVMVAIAAITLGILGLMFT